MNIPCVLSDPDPAACAWEIGLASGVLWLLLSCDGGPPKIYGPAYDAKADGPVASDAGPLDAGGDGTLPADGGDDGGACSAPTVLLAGSTGGLVGAARTGTGAFLAQALSGSLADRPAIVPLGTGFVAALRTAGDAVQATAFSASWVDPIAIGSAIARDAPALAAVGAVGHLAYQAKGGNVDYKYFHGQFSNGAWDAANDPVGGAMTQSFGPRAPSAAAAGGSLVLVQAGDDSLLYDQTWSGSWAAASQHANAAIQKTIPPAVVALEGGGEELLVVYARNADYKIMSLARAGNVWTTPVLVDANAFLSGATNEPVALAALAGGKALMVYRGTDSKPYFSVYDPGKVPMWTVPAPVIGGTNPSVESRPSVATGVCGADAVVAYAETAASVKVALFSGGGFGSPEAVPQTSGATYVAIATRK